MLRISGRQISSSIFQPRINPNKPPIISCVLNGILQRFADKPAFSQQPGQTMHLR